MLSANNKKLLAQISRLENELASNNQKNSTLLIDKQSSASRIADLEARIRSKDELNKLLEGKEIKFQDDVINLKNEVVRLTGVESLLRDRNSILIMRTKS